MTPALIFDLEKCLCCSRTSPLTGKELCASCAAALPHVSPTDTVGKCPVCHDWADLYVSDYLPREFMGCLTHALIATARNTPLPDTRHIGDPRNIA